MRRRKRWLLLIVLLAGGTAGPTIVLRQHPKAGRSFLRSHGFANHGSDDGNLLFSGMRQPYWPVVIVPPNTYYMFSSSGRFGELSGTLQGGRIEWARYGARTTGSAARYDGMIFLPVTAVAANARASKPAIPAGIRVIDELSREILRTLSPPTPVSQALCQNELLIAIGIREVYGFDPAGGKLLWRVDAGGSITTGIGGGDSAVCLGVDGALGAADSKTHELISIRVRDGRVLWRSPLPASPASTPAIDGHTVYCIAQNLRDDERHALCAMNMADGKSIWQCDDFPAALSDNILQRGIVPPSLVAGNQLACVSSGSVITGVDGASGKALWRYDPRTGSNPFKDEISPLLLHDGFIFFAAGEGAAAIDEESGKEVWSYRTSSLMGAIPSRYPPMVKGNLLVVPFRDDVHFGRLPAKVPSYSPSAAKPFAGIILIETLFAFGLATSLAIWIRRIKAFIALISLALAALTLYAWTGSTAATYSMGQREFAAAGNFNSQATFGIISSASGLTFGKTHRIWEKTMKYPVEGDPTHSVWWTRSSPAVLANGVCIEEPPPDLALTHFAWTNHSRPSGTPLGNQSETSLTLPHWFVILLLAIAPFAWLTGLWRDRRRYPKGHCTKCGYDLRATTERCSECGQAVPASSPNR